MSMMHGRVGVQLVRPSEHRREQLHLARNGKQTLRARSQRDILRQEVVVEILFVASSVNGRERDGVLLEAQARAAVLGKGAAKTKGKPT